VHLASIFAKLGIVRRTGLMALIHNYQIGLSNLEPRGPRLAAARKASIALHRQKFLNRSGASSVYRTVCWMFLCPSQACSARVSWPALARA
jgi:hypothetical protein